MTKKQKFIFYKFTKLNIHHNVFITSLMGSKAEPVLVKQLCCISSEQKKYRVYRKKKKMTNYIW